MKGIFAVAIVATAVALPVGAQVGTMGGAGGGSMMGGGTSMMGGERRMSETSASRAVASMSEGEVRKVDSAAGKLTLRHGTLENIDMPAMTMVFRVRDPGWLQQVKVGDKVRFVAERVDGNLTIVALEPERQ